MCHRADGRGSRSKNKAEASLEHRYYKRVFPSAATRCCGLALVFVSCWVACGLWLPVAGATTHAMGQSVPAEQMPPAVDPRVRVPALPAPASDPQNPAKPQPPAPRNPLLPAGVPLKPAVVPPPPPVPPKPLYDVAWSVPIAATGPFLLALTDTHIVVAAADAPMQAYTRANGAVAWTATAESDVAPAVAEGLIVAAAGRRLVAVRDTDGTTAWSADLSGDARGTFIVAGRALVINGQALDAFAVADGRRLWTAELSAAPVSNVAVSNRLALVGTSDPAVVAIDVETGRQAWRAALDVPPIALAGSADRVYFGTTDGRICSVRTSNGSRDWCPTVRVLTVGAPLVQDRFVYFAFLDNTLRTYDRRSGARQETATLSARAFSGPTLSGDAVAVPMVTGEFALVRTWKRDVSERAGTTPESPPTLQAAVASGDGTLLAALNLSTAGSTLTCLNIASGTTGTSGTTGSR